MIDNSGLKAYRYCPNKEVYASLLTCLKYPIEIKIPLDGFHERRETKQIAEILGCAACEYRNTPRPESSEPLQIISFTEPTET